MVSNSDNTKPVTQAIDEFLAFLVSEHPKIQKIVVALSGGMDSVCLLHGLSNAAKTLELIAVYIDHGLQEESKHWAQVNNETCESLAIEFHSVSVKIDQREASLEQAARNARYKALSGFIDNQSCLVTAQHLDDQAETLLLQMLRGAGAKGLSAMPFIKPFAEGLHARPLLKVSKSSIEDYVAHYCLSNIEDPSNNDLSIRRNFLRKKIIPKLKEHWPQINQSLYKVSANLAESQQLLEEVAAEDFSKVSNNNCLDIVKLKSLSNIRQTNLLRYWLASNHLQMPSKEFLNEILAQLLNAIHGSDPVIEIGSYQLRRYQDLIYLIKSIPNLIDTNQVWQWKLAKDLLIEDTKIKVKDVLENWPELEGLSVNVRYRRAGDKYYLTKGSQGQSLKNYFQENKVPTWLREHYLLVEFIGKIVFIQQKNVE